MIFVFNGNKAFQPSKSVSGNKGRGTDCVRNVTNGKCVCVCVCEREIERERERWEQ